MLIRANPSCHVMEHCRSDDCFCVRNSSRFRGWGGRREGYSVVKGYEDQGEGDEAPTIVADVVEFQVVRCEVELGWGTEPWIRSVLIGRFAVAGVSGKYEGARSTRKWENLQPATMTGS